jgi:hypothetical protein
MTYINNQIERLGDSGIYGYRIKICNGEQGESTNWMSIDRSQLLKIKEVLGNSKDDFHTIPPDENEGEK